MNLKRYAIKNSNGILLRNFIHSTVITTSEWLDGLDYPDEELISHKVKNYHLLTDDKKYTQIWMTNTKDIAQRVIDGLDYNISDIHTKNTEREPNIIMFIDGINCFKHFSKVEDLSIIELNIENV